MQAVIKFVGRVLGLLLSAVGLAVWLGGTALIVYWGVSQLGQDAASSKIGGIVVAAGAIIALVGSVIVLRVSHNLISFAVCLALGVFAMFLGGKFNPVTLFAQQPVLFSVATAAFLVPVAALAVTRKWIPFLVTMALFGIAAAVTPTNILALLQPGATQGANETVEEAANEPAPTAPAAPADAPIATAPPPAATPDEPPPQVSEMQVQPPPPIAAPSPPRASGPDDALSRSSGAGASASAGAAPGGAVRSRAPIQPSEAARAEPSTIDILPRAGTPDQEIATAAPPPPGVPASAPADAKPSDFQVAELKFNKPDQMKLGQSYVVDAIIAGEKAKDETVALGDVGPTVTRQTQITRKVRVELVANDFEITKLHKVDTLLITPETSGQWSWRVKALHPGADRRMLLQVFGVLEKDGAAQGEILIKTYEEKISVDVTPMDQVRLVSQDIVANWEPVAGALGVIGGIWAFVTSFLAGLRRKKENAA